MHQISNRTIALAVSRLAALRVKRKAIEAEEEKLKPLVKDYMLKNGLKRAATMTGDRVHLDHGTRRHLEEEMICEVLRIDNLDQFRTKRMVPRLTCYMGKGTKTFSVSTSAEDKSDGPKTETEEG